MLDINKIREDYPILQRQIEGRPLIYLDNAATSQTPRPVVEAINQMYYHYKANVHRGVHTLSQEATDLVEQTREKVRAFINADSIEEVRLRAEAQKAFNTNYPYLNDDLPEL